MSRLSRLLAVGSLLGAACAGEEFTSTQTSSSSQFTGASGGGGTGGTSPPGGAGLGANAAASQGGTSGKASARGGEPSAGGEPDSAGGTQNSASGGRSSTGGVVSGAGSDDPGEAGTAAGGSACPPGMIGPTCSNLPRACRDLPAGSEDGTYRIDPDAAGPIAPLDASCAFDASGGWTLILNYVHKGGTNPPLAPRKDALPLLGSDELGVDESALPRNWGHATASLLSALQPQALRFQGRISQHDRVVDFSTSDHDCLTYVMGGSTNCKALATNSSLLGAHSANLPRVATAFMSGKGDLALTEFPFYLGGQAHWAIKGEMQRWELDNTPVAGVLKYFYDTVHRVWMR